LTMPTKHSQAIDYAKIIAKRDKISIYDALPEASERFGLSEQELKSSYEIQQLTIKLTKQAARVKNYQKGSKSLTPL
jgi:hypothetical protein